MSDSNGQDRLPIRDQDVRAVVRLLGQVAGMTEPLPERRRVLVSGLAELVDADVWMWMHSAGLAEGVPVGLAVLEGGWRDEAERALVQRANHDPDFGRQIGRAIDWSAPSTAVFDAAHPGYGDGAVFENVIRPTGLTRILFSFHPQPGGLMSGIGLHRRHDRPRYTARDVALVHLVLTQVDWLHRLDPPPVAKDDGLRTLTPRQRELLLYLAGGDGRKQIAAKMGLSNHTIDGYCKAIYRRLNVASRSELLAKFLPTAGIHPPAMADRDESVNVSNV